MAVYATPRTPATDLPMANAPTYRDGNAQDVLLECDDRPHPLHFTTVHADDDHRARKLVAGRWLRTEPDLHLRIVRVDGDWLTMLTDSTKGDRTVTKPTPPAVAPVPLNTERPPAGGGVGRTAVVPRPP